MSHQFHEQLAEKDAQVRSVLSDVLAVHLATPTETRPDCPSCDGNLDARKCEYCHTDGCEACMAQCPECRKWVCCSASKDCALLNIDSSEMCIHCAADHVGQLAEAANVKLPRLNTFEARMLSSAVEDLAMVHDDKNPANVVTVAKRDKSISDAYPSALGATIAITRWTGTRLAYLLKELGVQPS